MAGTAYFGEGMNRLLRAILLNKHFPPSQGYEAYAYLDDMINDRGFSKSICLSCKDGFYVLVA